MLQVFLVGRLLLGGYFLFSGVEHFTNLGRMAGHAASKGVPFAEAAVVFSGVLLVIAGVSFLLGVLPKIGVLAAAAFLVPVTFIMHAFWNDHSAAQRMADTINFTKNLGLLGASLMLLAIPEPWPYSVHLRRRLATRVQLPA